MRVLVAMQGVCHICKREVRVELVRRHWVCEECQERIPNLEPEVERGEQLDCCGPVAEVA